MRVLVTGGLGVIGSWVVRELLEAGHQPIAFDNRDDIALVGDIAGDFERRIGDIRDLEALTGLFADVDVVAHFAARLPAEADPYQGYSINALGPVGVFEAARRAGVEKVVWASAKAIYGELSGPYGYPTYEPVPESHPRGTLPTAPVYSSSKLLAETAAEHFADAFGMRIVALRFATIFGPGKLVRHGGTGLVTAIVEAALGGKALSVARGGDERDELIYVRDVARGTVAACLAEGSGYDVYNVGSGHLLSMPELAAATAAAIGPLDFEIGPGRDPFEIGLMYGRLDSARAAAEIGYRPSWTIDAAIRDYAEFLQARR